MTKHTQSFRRLLQTNCLGVFVHFVGLALKGLRISLINEDLNFPVDLFTITKEIFSGKYHILCSVINMIGSFPWTFNLINHLI